ncbi:MAG: thioredoxin family protein [Anaerolineae bacterium]|nr:thioredoxin family protein [Anaerolineae bacterium]MDW8067690.1 thioredoxin family protein [Anaerolineae bacterium]
MPLLSDEIRQEVSKILANLPRSVRLVMFTQEVECAYCAETRQLVEEIAELSDRITAEIYDFQADRAKAEELGIDKIPAIAVIGAQDYGVRFYGIPAGYEFTSFLHAIQSVAVGKPDLSDATLHALAEVRQPVHIQVFVTPTCPYCPQAVMLAHQMAIASPLIRADMIEATEFPHLAFKYQVMGVPRTVINETVHIEGAAPESIVVAKLREALGG